MLYFYSFILSTALFAFIIKILRCESEHSIFSWQVRETPLSLTNGNLMY